MRGEAEIKAAARDDQVTAERNGNKRDWRREKLGTLLDKLEEEVKEFKRAIDEEDREGIRLEGSDVRWTVTMIQDHHGVLELETGTRLEQRITQLEEALEKIQFRSWSNIRDVQGLRRQLKDINHFAVAALSREPSQKGRCQCQSGSSVLGQCKLEAGHIADCAFEFAEVPEKEEK